MTENKPNVFDLAQRLKVLRECVNNDELYEEFIEDLVKTIDKVSQASIDLGDLTLFLSCIAENGLTFSQAEKIYRQLSETDNSSEESEEDHQETQSPSAIEQAKAAGKTVKSRLERWRENLRNL